MENWSHDQGWALKHETKVILIWPRTILISLNNIFSVCAVQAQEGTRRRKKQQIGWLTLWMVGCEDVGWFSWCFCHSLLWRKWAAFSRCSCYWRCFPAGLARNLLSCRNPAGRMEWTGNSEVLVSCFTISLSLPVATSSVCEFFM